MAEGASAKLKKALVGGIIICVVSAALALAAAFCNKKLPKGSTANITLTVVCSILAAATFVVGVCYIARKFSPNSNIEVGSIQSKNSCCGR